VTASRFKLKRIMKLYEKTGKNYFLGYYIHFPWIYKTYSPLTKCNIFSAEADTKFQLWYGNSNIFYLQIKILGLGITLTLQEK